MSWTQRLMQQIVCDVCEGPGPVAVSRSEAVREALAVGWTCRGKPLSDEAEWCCRECANVRRVPQGGRQDVMAQQADAPTGAKPAAVDAAKPRAPRNCRRRQHVAPMAAAGRCLGEKQPGSKPSGADRRDARPIEQTTRRLLAVCRRQGVTAVISEAITSRELLASLAKACHGEGMTSAAQYLFHLDKISIAGTESC